MTEPLKLEHIVKQFNVDGTEALTLDNISLEVEPGEFICIIGPSGGGKSTLLKIIAGLMSPTSGVISGRPNKMAYVFQNFALFPWLNVAENVGFGLKMAGTNEGKLRQRVDEEIRRMGLVGTNKLHPKELSGGMRQRVGIARALAVDPEILLLDEPFSALDEVTAAELRQDLLKIWEETGKTIIMVTHLAAEAAQLADRIVVCSVRPARIVKIITNGLKRPRQIRSAGFYALEDRLIDLLKG